MIYYKVISFPESKDMEDWLNSNDFWKIEGVWGTTEGVHLLYSYKKEN